MAAPITVPAARLPTLPPMALPIRPPVTAPTAVPPTSFGPESAVQAATLKPRSRNAMRRHKDIFPKRLPQKTLPNSLPAVRHLANEPNGAIGAKLCSHRQPHRGMAALQAAMSRWRVLAAVAPFG